MACGLLIFLINLTLNLSTFSIPAVKLSFSDDWYCEHVYNVFTIALTIIDYYLIKINSVLYNYVKFVFTESTCGE